MDVDATDEKGFVYSIRGEERAEIVGVTFAGCFALSLSVPLAEAQTEAQTQGLGL